MKNNDDVARSSTDYFERKTKVAVRNQSYKIVHGSLDHFKEKRKIKVHRNSIVRLQNLDLEINNYNQIHSSQSDDLSPFEEKTNKSSYKINNINDERNILLDKRENLLRSSPKLRSSLDHLEGQRISRNVLPYSRGSYSSKEYKTDEQKKYNQQKIRKTSSLSDNSSNQFKIQRKENSFKISNRKEKDLDNDGVPDRIDIDDTRNSVQTTADLSKSFNRDSHFSKTYKTNEQKKYNQQKIRKTSSLRNSKANKFVVQKKENSFKIRKITELNLGKDGVLKKHSISNLRISTNSVHKLSSAGIIKSQTNKNIQKKKYGNIIIRNKNRDLNFKNKKIILRDRNKSDFYFSNIKKSKTKKNIKLSTEDKIKKKKKMLHSPLTSKSVGQRTRTQKMILAPTKALSGVGGSFKEGINKEIENSDMEGIKLANSIVSPIARKLRFQTTSLVAKKVGFDRKAYNLSKIEKKIMKIDNKTLRVKKAQRKMIRKKAVINAKTVKGSKLDLVGRIGAISSQSAKQIKAKILLMIKEMISAVKGMKIVALLSGGLLIAIIPMLVLAPLFLFGSGAALTSATAEANNQEINFSASALSSDVMKWEGKVAEELNRYGLIKYKDLVLVLINLESGGLLPDVMQSSESLGLPPNTLTDPNKSIEAGVKLLKEAIDLMNTHNVDIQTVIHSYNYGTGFIPYVAENGGKWTQRLADNFSDSFASKLGWKTYGDKQYVAKALKFLTISNEDIIINVNSNISGGKLAYPLPNYESAVSSSYGWRIHPITGERKFHTGTDIPAPTGTPVIAVADGKVIEAGWKGGYGNAVMIDHGSNIVTLYGHNSVLDVIAGQTVKTGQVIAKVGSTGESTGPHLHFEVRKNGEFTDPVSWITR